LIELLAELSVALAVLVQQAFEQTLELVAQAPFD
jgi:hypothetical protein